MQCARQTVPLANTISVLTSHCNESLNGQGKRLLRLSPKCLTSSSKRSLAIRSPTGITTSAKRNKDASADKMGNSIDEETTKTSPRSMNFSHRASDRQDLEMEENPLTLDEKIQGAIGIP